MLDIVPGVALRSTPGWQRGGPTDLMSREKLIGPAKLDLGVPRVLHMTLNELAR
jgi:hypothetical protein